MALAAPRLIKYLGSAKADTAKIQVEKLGGVLDLYHLEIGRYPTDQEGLTALVERPPAGGGPGTVPISRTASSPTPGAAEPLPAPGHHGDYDLYSLGADGKEGGEGEDRDVTSW